MKSRTVDSATSDEKPKSVRRGSLFGSAARVEVHPKEGAPPAKSRARALQAQLQASQAAEQFDTSFMRLIPPAFHMLTNWDTELLYMRKMRRGTLTSKDKLHRFLGSPVSSKYGIAVSFSLLIISIASIMTLGIENQNEASELLSALNDGSYANGSYTHSNSQFRVSGPASPVHNNASSHLARHSSHHLIAHPVLTSPPLTIECHAMTVSGVEHLPTHRVLRGAACSSLVLPEALERLLHLEWARLDSNCGCRCSSRGLQSSDRADDHLMWQPLRARS